MKYIVYRCDKCNTEDVCTDIYVMPRFVKIKEGRQIKTILTSRNTHLCKKCAAELALYLDPLDETEEI